MSVFQKYSSYYDLLYKDKDYVGESNFIRDLIKKYSPDAASVLEFGSGSGHHADLLANDFESIDGCDLSADMLDLANLRKEKSANRLKLNFTQGNIKDVDFKKKADAAISLFHVVSYLNENEINILEVTARDDNGNTIEATFIIPLGDQPEPTPTDENYLSLVGVLIGLMSAAVAIISIRRKR